VHLYDVNTLVVPNLSFLLDSFVFVMVVMGKFCNFCILLGDFGGSCMSAIGIFSGSGLWWKFWLGQFAISGSSVYDC
jgi:hypothetical protein